MIALGSGAVEAHGVAQERGWPPEEWMVEIILQHKVQGAISRHFADLGVSALSSKKS